MSVTKRAVETYISHPDEEYREENSSAIVNILKSMVDLEVHPSIMKLVWPDFAKESTRGHIFATLSMFIPLVNVKSEEVRKQLARFLELVSTEPQILTFT